MSEFALVFDRLEKEHTMTPEDAVLDITTALVVIIDAAEITDYDRALDEVRRMLDTTNAGAAVLVDPHTATLAALVECAYGRPSLSNIEWGMLKNAVRIAATAPLD